ncbi:MAG: hypothetical protein WA771_01630, partial [Chthoniobacterales bacterium]
GTQPVFAGVQRAPVVPSSALTAMVSNSVVAPVTRQPHDSLVTTVGPRPSAASVPGRNGTPPNTVVPAFATGIIPRATAGVGAGALGEPGGVTEPARSLAETRRSEAVEAETIEAPEGTTVPAALEATDESIAAEPAKKDRLRDIQNEFADSLRDQSGRIPREVDRAEWQTAQWLADQRYRAMFGQQAFNAQQRTAALEIGGGQ